MACNLSARKNVVVEFLNKSFQDLLISHLYQHLVRYTELNVRHAVRSTMPPQMEIRTTNPIL